MSESSSAARPHEAAGAMPEPHKRMAPGWLMVALGFLLYLLATGPIYQTFSVMSIAWGKEFGVNKALIALLFSGCIVMQRFAGAIVGPMFDRHPVRWLLVVGITGVTGGLILASQVAAMWQMAALYLLVFPFVGSFTASFPSNMLIARSVDRNIGLAIGVAMVGSAVGTIVFPSLTPRLLEMLPWRSVYLIYAGGVVVLLPLVLLLLRGPIGGGPKDQPAPVGGGARPVGTLTVKAALRRPVFWGITIGVGTMLGATAAIVVSIVHMGVSKGLTPQMAGGLASLVGLGAFLGKLAFGFAADKLGQRNAIRLGLACCALGIALLVSDSGAVLAAGAFIAGLGQGGMLPVWAAACRSEFGLADYGKALGWTSAAMIPMVLALPAISGHSFDRWQSYTPGLFAVVAALLLALVCHFFIPAEGKDRAVA